MATVYPNNIQRFKTMVDIDAADGLLIKQYQDAIDAGNWTLAWRTLREIKNVDQKILSADFLNTITDTLVAIQGEYLKRYNPSITVSYDAPQNPENTDYWWEIERWWND